MEVCLFKQRNLLEIPLRFDAYLFLTSKHLLTQTTAEIFYFYLFRTNENAAAAVFQCILSFDQKWLSPARAPFGGIQCEDDCTVNEITFFIGCIDEWITSGEGNKIIIKLSPSCYNVNSDALISDSLIKKNYKKTKNYSNHFIHVTSCTYENLILASERRRLKKCIQTGFTSNIYKTPAIEIVYGFLQHCRSEKGYNLSVTAPQLQELFTVFPKEIVVFTVKDQEKIIALNVTVRINQSILYHFLSSHLSSYAQYSPAVMLTEEIYTFCQIEGISILDLGISLDHHGNEKPGLIRFKENIGGKRSYKSIYEKVLK